MKKQFLSLSITCVIALTGAVPAYADDCVEVQSRFALANCMAESAVSIAAAAASENGCQAREWNIDVIVPEYIGAKLPVQGLTIVEGNGDFYELGGSSSAMLRNNVNCQVNTTASGNTFDGVDLTYSAGSGNYYVDAIVEPSSPTVCISSVLSSSDVALGGANYDEDNSLVFEGESDEISAVGWIRISQSAAKGKGAPSEVISEWTVEEEVTIPEEGEIEAEGFKLEATTNDIGDCQIKVKGSVENLTNLTIEHEEGGLTFSGSISIEPDDDDEEEED